MWCILDEVVDGLAGNSHLGCKNPVNKVEVLCEGSGI
jgi:hypothetical protein